MQKFLHIVLVLCAMIVASTAARADIIGGVDFPSGEASFADAVISYDPGPGVSTDHDNPSDALGTPNFIQGSGVGFVSLGWGGTVVLKFTDNFLTTSGNSDKDLWIFEVGVEVEGTYVSVSLDGVEWLSLGSVGGSTKGIDLDAYVGSGITAGGLYSYVKLTDMDQHLSTNPYAGADIDAIGAISSTAAVPAPAALWLLVSGLIGLVGLRKKAGRY